MSTIDQTPRATATGAAATVSGLLLVRAESMPDRPAYCSAVPGGPRLTWQELCARAADVSRRIIDATSAGDRVLLVYDDPLEFVPAFFGCLLAGTIAVPAPSRRRGDTLEAIARDCGAVVALASSRPALPDWLERIDSGETASAHTMRPRASGTDVVLLQYTSGSTRSPRGVMVTNRSLLATLEDLDRGAAHSEESVIVSWLPHYHDLGLVYGILEPVYRGLPAYLMTPQRFLAEPLSWLRAIALVRGTHTAAPDSAYALCAERAADLEPSVDLSSLRVALNGAEPVRCENVRRFQEAFAPFGLRPRVVTPGYGLAEATLKVATARRDEGMRETFFDADALAAGSAVPCRAGRAVALAACGGSLNGTRVLIVDPESRIPREAGRIGEIWVAGDTVARGYWGRDAETEQTFRARTAAGDGPWLRTGDLGFVREGALYVTGRIKDLIIVGGRNIHPHDVERTIARIHPHVRDGRVFAAADGDGDREQLLIGAELRGRCDGDTARAIVRAIRSAVLEEHDVAAARVVLLRRGSIRRTSSGKIRRAATRDALARGELRVYADFRGPAATSDDGLAALIAAIVPGAADDPDVPLVQTGLDSLAAARLASAARARFGCELALATLPGMTANELRERIAREAGLAGAEPAVLAGDAFPLTELQEAYWIGRRAGVPLGNVAPCMRVEFEIEANDVPRLRERLRALVRKHPMLRSEVLPDGTVAIRESPYDPETEEGRPLSAKFARAGATTARLQLRLDLLAGDFRSLLILAEELAAEELPAPDPAAARFADFAAGLRARTVSAADRDYWTGRLDAMPPAPVLPLAADAASIEEPRFARIERELSDADSAALATRAAALGVTPTSLCIAAFADALRLWSAAPELTLNVTRFQRPDGPPFARVIGDFSANVLLAVPPGEASFAAFAQAVQRQLWSDLDHAAFSGVAVARELGRRAGAPVLLPVVVTSLLAADGSSDLEVLDRVGRVVDARNPTPHVALHNILARRHGRMVVAWEYVAQLFAPATIEAMFSTFVAALESIARSPAVCEQAAVAAIPPQQAARREAANATLVVREPARLETGFAAQALRAPAAPAVIAPDGTVSYGELFRAAEEMAASLQHAGCGRGDIVAAIVEPGWRAIASLLGIELAGAAYVPIDPSLPEARRAQLLEESGARAAVTTSGPAMAPVTLPFDERARGARPHPAGGSPDDLAYVIFTSGSTGRPKGVAIAHDAATNTIADINERFRVGPHDRVLAVSSLSFDLSVFDVFGLLAAGGTVIVPGGAGARDPHMLARTLREHRVTIWNSVPAVLDLLLGATDTASEAMRHVLLSGDWIPLPLPDRARAAFPNAQVTSLGGATEAAIWSVVRPIERVDPVWRSIPYGTPLANQRCFVRASDGRERPDGVAGELLIGGRGVAVGYHRNPEETAARFVAAAPGERLYRTGDLARWLPSGELELLGRIDDQVKVQGYRIELGEIEAQAMRVASVARAVAATGVRDRSTQIRLYILPAGARDESLVSRVREELVRTLPRYMQPHYVCLIDEVPLTANGKVDRKRLPLPSAAPPATAPRSAAGLEPAIAAAFAEILGHAIDPRQNLFECGVTSLHIVRAHALLQSRGAAVPPVVDFFTFPNIRALAHRAPAVVASDDAPERVRAYRARVRRRVESA